MYIYTHSYSYSHTYIYRTVSLLINPKYQNGCSMLSINISPKTFLISNQNSKYKIQLNESHPYFHMLSKYQDFEPQMIVNIIYRSRNTAFKILKRTSAKWEKERISISNIPKLKLSDVPPLYLKRTHSQENINIHSIRIRSKSVPHHSSTFRHKLHLKANNNLPIIIDNIDICNDDCESYSCRTVGTLPSASHIDQGIFPTTFAMNTGQKRRSLFANSDTKSYENKRTSNSMRKRFLRKLFKNHDSSHHQQPIRRGRGRVRDITHRLQLNDSYSNRMMQMPSMSRIGSLPPKMKSRSNPSSNRSSISRKIIRRLSLLRSSLTDDDDKPSMTMSATNSSVMSVGSSPLPVLTRRRSKSQEDNTSITINTAKVKNQKSWKNRMRIRRHSSKIPSTDLTTSGKQMILNSRQIIPQRKLLSREFTHPSSASASASPFLPHKKKAKIHWGMQHNTYGQQQPQSLRLPFYNISPETDTSCGDISSDAALSNNEMPPPLRITSAYSSAPTRIPYHTSIMINNTTSSSNTAQLAIPMNNLTNSDEQYFSDEEYKHYSLLDYIANTNSSNKIEFRKLKPPTLTPVSITATPLSDLSSDGYPYTHDAVLPNSPLSSPTSNLADIPNTTLSPIISGQIYLQSSDENEDREKRNSNFLNVVDHTHSVIANKNDTHEIMSREENSDIYEHTPEHPSPYSPPQRLIAYLKTSDATESDLYSLNSRKTSNITCTPKQSTDREYLEIDEKQIINDKKIDIHPFTKIYSDSEIENVPQIMGIKETIRTQSDTVTEIETIVDTTHTESIHKTTDTDSKEDTLSENVFITDNGDGNELPDGTFVTVRLMTDSSHSALGTNHSRTDSQPIPSPFYHSLADTSDGAILHNISEDIDINTAASIDTDVNDNGLIIPIVCTAVDEEESNSVPPTPSSEDFGSLSSGAKQMLPTSAMYELTQLKIDSESPMSVHNPYSRPSDQHMNNIDIGDDDQHSTSPDIQQQTASCVCCVL